MNINDEIDFYKELLNITPSRFKDAQRFLREKLKKAMEARAQELTEEAERLEKHLNKCSDVIKSIAEAISRELKACTNSLEEFRELEAEAENFIKKAKEIDTSKESDKITRELYSITPMRFRKAREEIGKEIIKREVIKEISSQDIQEQEQEEAIDLEVLRKDFSIFAHKVRTLDEEAGVRVSELEREISKCEESFRAKLLLEEVKKTYIEVRNRVALTRVLKEDIQELKKHIKSQELLKEADRLLSKKYVEKAEFFAFRKKVWQEGLKEGEIQEVKPHQVISKLRELGYTIVGDEEEIGKALEEGQVVELRTPHGEDYVLKVKVQDGKITTKFVKILEEERELSSYEKERDIYTAKKWCEDFDKLLEKLKEEGVNIEVKARIEPDERGIDYEVRKKEKRRTAREEKHGRPEQKRRSI